MPDVPNYKIYEIVDSRTMEPLITMGNCIPYEILDFFERWYKDFDPKVPYIIREVR